MKTAQLCSEANGGNCKNKVSARNGFVCAAGHSKSSSTNGVARSTISIAKMERGDREDLAAKTENETLHLQLLRTEDYNLRRAVAQNPSISEAIQWELFNTGDIFIRHELAKKPLMSEDLQRELFDTGNLNIQLDLARNPSIARDIQWKILRGESTDVKSMLALNPSIDEDLQWELFQSQKYAQWNLARNPLLQKKIAIELAIRGISPSGYLSSKTLTELAQPENLALLDQYPKAFGEAYLSRLVVNNPQENRDESKALILHSYLIYEKSRGGSESPYTKDYKNNILKRYADDQEVALILSTKPAQ